jgi:hypothetical protein
MTTTRKLAILLTLWSIPAAAVVLLVDKVPVKNTPMVWQVTKQGIEWKSDRVFSGGFDK